jgi:hypothetical protein
MNGAVSHCPRGVGVESTVASPASAVGVRSSSFMLMLVATAALVAMAAPVPPKLEGGIKERVQVRIGRSLLCGGIDNADANKVHDEVWHLL